MAENQSPATEVAAGLRMGRSLEHEDGCSECKATGILCGFLLSFILLSGTLAICVVRLRPKGGGAEYRKHGAGDAVVSAQCLMQRNGQPNECGLGH